MIKAKLMPVQFEWTSANGDHHKSVEKVMLITDDYPEALIHIDSLIDFGDDLYNRLVSGETIEAEITVKEMK